MKKCYVLLFSLFALNALCMDSNDDAKKEIENIDLFRACKKINEIVSVAVKQAHEKKDLTDFLLPDQCSPHPAFNQTKKGILVEFHDNVPSELWTPWGTITLLGAITGKAEVIRQKLEERVALSQYTEKQPAKWMDGVTYYVDSIDGMPRFPKATIKCRVEYIEDHVVFQSWEDLEKKCLAIPGSGNR